MNFASYDTTATTKEKLRIYFQRKETFAEDSRFHHAYVDLVSEERTPSQNTLCLRMLKLACRIGKVGLVVFPSLDGLSMDDADLLSLLEELSEKGIYIAFDAPPSPDPEEDSKEEAWQIHNRIEGDLLIAAITMESCCTKSERGIPFVTLEKDAVNSPDRASRLFADVLEEQNSGFFVWKSQPGCWFYVNHHLIEETAAAVCTFWSSIEEEMLN